MSLFPSVPTGLDLNGPYLSFTTQPVGVATTTGATISLSGIATATFSTVGVVTNSVDNAGSLSYQWYRVGVGSLTDGTTISGSGTTTLTLSSLSENENGGEYYVQADYVPSSSVGLASTSIGGVLTGNAPNEPLSSGVGFVTVFPNITIVDQPSAKTVAIGTPAIFSVYATATDGTTGDIVYKWQEDGSNLTDGTTVAGSGTTELTMTDSTTGLSTITCKLTHPTANPSPVYTNVVNYTTIDPRDILLYECFSENSTTLNDSGEQDLGVDVLSFRADTSAATRSIMFYPSEKDIEVKITMAGSRGDTSTGYRRGHGGLSVFKITLKKNVEYTVKLGVPHSANIGPQGGKSSGGGIAVFYRKGNVVAVCGGGGGSGSTGRGGDGGGVNLGGETGQGNNGGGGGEQLQEGDMGTVGSYARASIGETEDTINFDITHDQGGLMTKCTVGDYYAQQGYAPCEDLGSVQARTYDGDIIIGSASIERGYKAGKGYRENGGNTGDLNKGGGGAGAYGGDAPRIGTGGGGGGGSGYSNGEITLLTSDTLPTGTRQGGNDDTAFITVEVLATASDNEPNIPAASSI
tara:strand:+ start:288 stop:2018 length:1731 start_codon:yes stop_codon:yes gene_type:complete